jgi:WD40 repeat protein
VALRAGDKARQQLVCLARASANGYVYQANSVEDLRDVLQQVERGETPAQIPENWPISYTLELPRRAYGLDWSPDGKVVLVDTDREVWSWDLTSGQTVTIPVAGANAAWSPDGKQLAYFGGGGHIGIWNGDSTITLASDVPGKYSGAYSLSWSPDGQKIAAGSLDGTVPIWDIASQTSVRLSGHTGAVFNVAWSPDGKQVASAGSDKTVRLWDAATSQPLHVLEEDCCILGITWSPDSQYLAVAGDGDSTVRIWDVASGQLAARILSRYTGERTLRWSSDGAYLTRGSEILDMRRQQSLGRLGDPAALGWAWSPDSTRLAISSAVPQVDGNRYFVRVWAVPPATP